MTDRPDLFAAALARVLAAEGVRRIRLDVPGRGPVSVSLAAAVSPDGLMPAFLVASDAVLRAATGGRGFGPHFEPDPAAVLGYRVADPGVSHAVALICAAEVIRQVVQDGGELPADELMRVWREARAVAEFGRDSAAPMPGPGPQP
jgi:hypothetical protein